MFLTKSKRQSNSFLQELMNIKNHGTNKKRLVRRLKKIHNQLSADNLELSMMSVQQKTSHLEKREAEHPFLRSRVESSWLEPGKSPCLYEDKCQSKNRPTNP